jgi:hypothetical protein
MDIGAAREFLQRNHLTAAFWSQKSATAGRIRIAIESVNPGRRLDK